MNALCPILPNLTRHKIGQVTRFTGSQSYCKKNQQQASSMRRLARSNRDYTILSDIIGKLLQTKKNFMIHVRFGTVNDYELY